MKHFNALLAGGLFAAFCLQNAQAQTHFKSGTIQLEENIRSTEPKSVGLDLVNGRYVGYATFNQLPSDTQHEELKSQGIKLLEYVPNNTYLVSIPTTISSSDLADMGITGIHAIPASTKIGKRASQAPYPDYALKGNKALFEVVTFEASSLRLLGFNLESAGYTLVERLDFRTSFIVEAPSEALYRLADLNLVKHVDLIPAPGEPESDDGRNLHRSNAIDREYTGGYSFNGSGVTIAINDDGAVGPHIDFTGRVDQSDVANDFTGTHGDMTAGIAGGAGNLDPEMRGMAPFSYMFIRQYRSNMSGTENLHLNDDVMIFSSSYSNGCNAGYTNTTRLVDSEIWDNPSLLQVFSGGNSNNNDCGYGAGSSWGNITGGHKIAKNVIATANLDPDDLLRNSSSRGPAEDGRIKPDISAHGHNQMSTDPDNTYAPGGGTSAACPGITGVTAQLYQAYREWNSGQDPNSALIKAALLNTANDLGNTGPDFSFGFGKVNALRALRLLEENRYMQASVAPGDSNLHTITIPAGTEQARIMVYWAEQEASTSAALHLINNLDATLSDGTNTYYPWILDHTPDATTLALPATTGIDSINNVEQIELSAPTAGTYTLKVKGTALPFGSHDYFVVYEFRTAEPELTFPVGGEGLLPGQNRVHWDAYGNSGNFSLELSTDNGSTWSSVGGTGSAARFATVTLPNTATGQALMRITRNGMSDVSDAPFTIMHRPENLRVNRVCTGTSEVLLVWDPVSGATGYDVFRLGNSHMDSVMSVSTNLAAVPVNSLTEVNWFAVRATGPNGMRSLRTIAIQFEGIGGPNNNCYLSCESDHDAGVRSIQNPIGLIVACDDTLVPVEIEIENIGLNSETGFNVHYQLGNEPIVTELYSSTLAPGAIETFTFAQSISANTSGDYTLRVWTELATDSTACNNEQEVDVRAVNQITTFPFSEDFEQPLPSGTGDIQNPDGEFTWERRACIGASGNSTNVLYVNNYNYDGAGEEDYFEMVPTELNIGTEAYLHFDVAYRPYDNNNTDSLRVEISTDCGANFTQIWAKGGYDLTISGDDQSQYLPLSINDWLHDSADLSAYLGQKVVIRFVNVTGYGNNLHLDNIQIITDVATSVPELEENAITLAPNPASETISLAGLPASGTITILDVTGKTVMSSSITGEQEVISISELPVGNYVVKVISNTHLSTEKLTIVR